MLPSINFGNAIPPNDVREGDRIKKRATARSDYVLSRSTLNLLAVIIRYSTANEPKFQTNNGAER